MLLPILTYSLTVVTNFTKWGIWGNSNSTKRQTMIYHTCQKVCRILLVYLLRLATHNDLTQRQPRLSVIWVPCFLHVRALEKALAAIARWVNSQCGKVGTTLTLNYTRNGVHDVHMKVSWNGGTPKSSILIGLFHYKQSILGCSHLWKPPYDMVCLHHSFRKQECQSIMSGW